MLFGIIDPHICCFCSPQMKTVIIVFLHHVEHIYRYTWNCFQIFYETFKYDFKKNWTQGTWELKHLSHVVVILILPQLYNLLRSSVIAINSLDHSNEEYRNTRASKTQYFELDLKEIAHTF